MINMCCVNRYNEPVLVLYSSSVAKVQAAVQQQEVSLDQATLQQQVNQTLDPFAFPYGGTRLKLSSSIFLGRMC